MGPSRGFWLREIVLFLFLPLPLPPSCRAAWDGPSARPRSGQPSHRALGRTLLRFGVQPGTRWGAACCNFRVPRAAISGLTGWPEEGVTATLRAHFSL